MAATNFTHLALKPVVRRESLFISLTAYDVFVEVDGTGPYMIMMHGLGTSTHVFQPLVEIFSSEYTIIRFDWPGHGRSSLNKSGTKITVPSCSNLLEELMDHLRINSAIVAGHSLGGIVGMMLAANNPKRVNGLAVMAAGRTKAHNPEGRKLNLEQAQWARDGNLPKEIDIRVSANIPSTSSPLSRALLRAVTGTTNIEGYAQTLEALCDDSHADPDYSKIECRTCVIGGRYDKISPVNTTYQLAGLISAGGNEVNQFVLETGHMMVLEEVEGTAMGIKQMLLRIGNARERL